MSGATGSMMGAMMGFGWLPMLVGLALVVAVTVVVVQLLVPAGEERGARTVVLGVLAAIGGIALVALLAMATMHFGMSCC